MDDLASNQKRNERKIRWEADQKREQKKKLVNKIVMWSVVVLLIVGGIWAVISVSTGTQTASNAPSLADKSNIPSFSSTDLYQGNKNSQNILIEYADFQCPTCKYYYPILKHLAVDMDKNILYIYRFFPLTNIHKNALLSARSAYSAGKQGKFWEMHDLLFENQGIWEFSDNAPAIFEGYAKKLNLDLTKYNQDLNKPETQKVIMTQEQSGLDNGINGTPTFFLNGRQILNPPNNYQDFKKFIESQTSR